VLVLSEAEVKSLLDIDRLIDALAVTMSELSAGRASMPQRIAARVPERDGVLGAMPAYVPAAHALTTKLVSLFPRNAGTPIPTHQAVIVAFDPETGSPTALLDGTYITAMRTAACSALSARLLAREDASVLAILGAGVQAHAHALCMTKVRQVREIRIATRDRNRAQQLADELARESPRDKQINLRVADSYEQAIKDADIICACTHATEPVVRRDWLRPGVHITSVGYNVNGREIDDETVAASLLCVESCDAALAPPPVGTPDLLQPIAHGLIRREQIVEIGELISGAKSGRTGDDQITLYKSVGVAVQDAAAAALVLQAASKRNAGQEVRI
jgi:alanine dehydrogenase